VKVGNEVVLYRHEKTFYNRCGLFIKVKTSTSEDKLVEQARQIDQYQVNYVGMELEVDGIAVEDDVHDSEKFKSAITTIRSVCKKPLIIISSDLAVLESGLSALNGETPMIAFADKNNWEKLTELASKYKTSLAIASDSLDEFAELTEKIKAKGVEDMVLIPMGKNLGHNLILQTQIRKAAIKGNIRSLGYPTLTFCSNPVQAGQAVTKYSGFVVLEDFAPELVYPLLVLRQNIYTDPQKPIQVQPGLYEINNPKETDPVLVTTNFSITYFSVANEVEGSGLPAWLLVADAEGMSVLTAWAAGKFDADRIAKAVKTTNVSDKLSKRRLVLPGAVAVLSGEVEAELPDWEIRVGPREAVDIPKFYKQALQAN
ncbi:MAG: acetyl-CoA decarbonylase/synthase complex subunit gamma, partial [Anaerolineales bacterium]